MDFKRNSTKKTKNRHIDLNQLTDHKCKAESETETETDSYLVPDYKGEEMKKLRKRLCKISRGPAECPLSNCSQNIIPTELLTHFLHKHACTGKARIGEVFDHQSIRMHIDPFEYQCGKVDLLAILMFGGVQGKPETLPAYRYISLPNVGLLRERSRFENHIPIMVLISKTTWYALLEDKSVEEEMVPLSSDNATIYVIWLVSPSLTKKIHYTMTVFDRTYTNSRSVLRLVRDYKHSQDPSDFLRKEDNYMILREADVMEFLHADKNLLSDAEGLRMEIIIHERPNTSRKSKKTQYLKEAYDLQPFQQPKQRKFDLLQMPRIKSKTAKFSHKPTSFTAYSKKK